MDPKDSVALADLSSAVKLEAVKQIVKLQFQDSKTRIGDDTVRLVGEVVQLLIVEAAARSCNQALLSGSAVVEMEHVEKVLPKLISEVLLEKFEHMLAPHE